MAVWIGSHYFWYYQIPPLLIHLLIITIFAANQYNMIHFLYITPVILLLMYNSYQCFWKPKPDCSTLYIVLFGLGIFIFTGVFLGVFIGVFGQILKYPLHEVHNCQVIGQLKVNIIGISTYSILYVNYEKDGEVFLGYGCLDGQYQATSGIKPIFPYQFYQFGDSYGCPDTKVEDSYFNTFQQSRNLHYDAYKNKRSFSYDSCLEYWTFSKIKLPSWMCLPENFPYHSLSNKLNKCYISSHGNSQQAKLNSLNRANLKYATDFILVGFTDFLIPVDQYIIFLIFCYCPFIVTSVVITLPIQNCIQKQINKSKNYYKKIKHIPYLERVCENNTVLDNENRFIQIEKQNNFCDIQQQELQTLNQNYNNIVLDNETQKKSIVDNYNYQEIEQNVLKDGEQKSQINQYKQIQNDINL